MHNLLSTMSRLRKNVSQKLTMINIHHCVWFRFILKYNYTNHSSFVTTVWHCAKNFACPTAEVTWGLRAGTGAKTSDTTFLCLVYSTADYWSLVCSRSTCFIYSVLNEALRVITDASVPLQRTT